MKTLYLHIGTHKTGTTSFQQFLSDRKDYLIANGVYPHIEDGSPATQAGNSLEFAHYFVRPSLNTVVRAASKAHVHGLSEFLRYVRAFRRRFLGRACPDYIVSAEALCFLRTWPERMKLRFLAQALGARIVPIIVFRNDHDWRASWEHQLQSVPFVRSILSDPGFTIIDDWYFDKAAILKFWSGVGEVRTIDYDKAMESGGDIIEPLLEVLGVPCPQGTSYRLNPRTAVAGTRDTMSKGGNR